MDHARPTSHRRTAVAAASTVLTAALALSGCSSSGGTAQVGSGGSSAGSGASATSSSGSAAASAATSPAGSSTAAASVAGTQLRGGSGSGFCKLAAAESATQAKNASALTADSPAALEKFEKDGLAQLQNFVLLAPAAIRSDVETIAAGEEKLVAALAGAHYNIRSINAGSVAALNTPKFMAAAQAVETYLSKTCGIAPAGG